MRRQIPVWHETETENGKFRTYIIFNSTFSCSIFPIFPPKTTILFSLVVEHDNDAFVNSSGKKTITGLVQLKLLYFSAFFV